MDRYRVLRVALGFGEGTFTVLELAKKSGVNLATVRTVVQRDSRFFSRAGRQSVKGPGGRFYLYRLNAHSELVELLRGLYGEFPRQEVAPGTTDTTQEPEYMEPPAALFAARDVLLRQIPAEVDPAEKAKLIKSAAMDIEMSRQALAGVESRAAQRLLHRLDILEAVVISYRMQTPCGDVWAHEDKRLVMLLSNAEAALAQADAVVQLPPTAANRTGLASELTAYRPHKHREALTQGGYIRLFPTLAGQRELHTIQETIGMTGSG